LGIVRPARGQHGGRKAIAFAITQSEEDCHVARDVRFKPDIALDEALGRRLIARRCLFLLAEILRRNKKLEGMLYDQPQVVANAQASGFITAPDVKGRCTVEGGDFFQSVPKGADGYLMKYIIHDWDDAKCIRILENCRNAMAKGGRVLVVDSVIPKGNAKDWAKLLDINKMVTPGGKERTREEFRDIFARAGLRLTRVIPTKSDLSIVEAVAR
jgi:hypothetical protein